MKKLLRNKIFLSSVIALPLCASVISCSNTKNSDNDIKVKPIKEITHNEIIFKDILNKLNSNIQEQDVYLRTQKNISNSIFTELKASMIYANISNNNVLEKSPSELNNQVKNAIDAITNMLTINWYWYLDHLNNNTYVFNPYNSDFKNIPSSKKEGNKTPSGTKELFDYVKEQFDSWAFEIKDKEISQIKSFDLENKQSDIYKNKKLNFLVFGNDAFIPYFTYSKEENSGEETITKNYILVTPDVFRVINEANIDELINNFIDIFKKSYEDIIQDDINYAIQVGDDKSEATINAYKQYSDKNLISLYNPNNYSNVFYRTVNNLNNDKMQILRYTWGEINEN
ncbi:aromatic motif membrane protein [Mycoplasma sp. BRA285]